MVARKYRARIMTLGRLEKQQTMLKIHHPTGKNIVSTIVVEVCSLNLR